MDIYSIRISVKEMYPNQTWAKQVDNMADARVYAIYMKNVEKLAALPQKEEPPEQGTLF
jgi:hypothetical protein